MAWWFASCDRAGLMVVEDSGVTWVAGWAAVAGRPRRCLCGKLDVKRTPDGRCEAAGRSTPRCAELQPRKRIRTIDKNRRRDRLSLPALSIHHSTWVSRGEARIRGRTRSE